MNHSPSEPGLAAEPGLSAGAQARFHRFHFGEIECIALSDGGLPMSRPHAQEAASPNSETGGDGPPLRPLSCLLVRLPRTGLVLIDTGFGLNPVVGGTVLRTVGRLPASLAGAGVAPEDIDVVLISHIHPDHVGGLYGDDGAKLYPNASYHVGAEELAFWGRQPLDLSGTASPPHVKEGMANAAKRMLGFAGDTLSTFRAGEEVLPEVGTMLLPGHAPGQVGFILSSGAKKLLFTGDAIAEPVASIETPEVYNPMDMNPDLAVETRRKLIALLSQPEWRCFTPHFPWPNLGRVQTTNGKSFWKLALDER